MWNDIESAPRDGTIILLAEIRGALRWARDGYWIEPESTWATKDLNPMGFDFVQMREPTHWLHLPTHEGPAPRPYRRLPTGVKCNCIYAMDAPDNTSWCCWRPEKPGLWERIGWRLYSWFLRPRS